MNIHFDRDGRRCRLGEPTYPTSPELKITKRLAFQVSGSLQKLIDVGRGWLFGDPAPEVGGRQVRNIPTNEKNMAKIQRKTSHEELQRDEIADGVHDVIEGVYHQRYRILALVVVLIVVALGIYLYNASREATQRALNSEIATAMESYFALEAQTEVDQRAAQAEALVAQLDEIGAEYSMGLPLGRFAIYIKGMTHYAVDNFGEARRTYAEYLEQANTSEERARGEIAMAYAYENEGFFPAEPQAQRELLDQALAHYQQAAEVADGEQPYLYYYALLGQARALEAVGRNDEAIALYQRVIDERPLEVTEVEAQETVDAQARAMFEMVSRMLRETEEQIGLAATARLRLERLQARTGTGPAVETVITTVAP